MPKNIAIFSDGTGQDGGVRPEQRMSNVYKLYRVARSGPESGIDPREQIAFYDPGLGTDEGTTATSAPVHFIRKLLGSVTGRGVTTNIADCYEFIIKRGRALEKTNGNPRYGGDDDGAHQQSQHVANNRPDTFVGVDPSDGAGGVVANPQRRRKQPQAHRQDNHHGVVHVMNAQGAGNREQQGTEQHDGWNSLQH